MRNNKYESQPQPENMNYLLPGMWLDLREFEFGVIWIHLSYLIARRGTKDFYYLDKLIDATVAREYWLSEQKLCQDATGTPDIWKSSRVSSTFIPKLLKKKNHHLNFVEITSR